jgi:hypothetical protein
MIRPWLKVRRMHKMPMGPTGTAMDSPMIIPLIK